MRRGRHRANQDAGDFLAAEFRKESAKRAVMMLMRHRSSGDFLE